jgi:hypothetical protein
MGKFIAGTLRQGNLKDLHFVSRHQLAASFIHHARAGSDQHARNGSAKSQASPE